jgi:selenocysteine-specific translation elongation factor
VDGAGKWPKVRTRLGFRLALVVISTSLRLLENSPGHVYILSSIGVITVATKADRRTKAQLLAEIRNLKATLKEVSENFDDSILHNQDVRFEMAQRSGWLLAEVADLTVANLRLKRQLDES